MIIVLAVITGFVLMHLVRLVRHDGRGVRPPPRSHVAELGTWVDREMSR